MEALILELEARRDQEIGLFGGKLGQASSIQFAIDPLSQTAIDFEIKIDRDKKTLDKLRIESETVQMEAMDFEIALGWPNDALASFCIQKELSRLDFDCAIQTRWPCYGQRFPKMIIKLNDQLSIGTMESVALDANTMIRVNMSSCAGCKKRRPSQLTS